MELFASFLLFGLFLLTPIWMLWAIMTRSTVKNLHNNGVLLVP